MQSLLRPHVLLASQTAGTEGPVPTREFDFHWLTAALLLWVLLCLTFSAWRQIQGKLLPFQHFAWMALPCLLAAIVQPTSIWQAWQQSALASSVTQRLDAMVTVGFGAAAGIVWARLVAPVMFREMDYKLMRQDEPTRQARHLIGTFALAGSWLGWQSMTVVALLTGLIAIAVALVSRKFTSSKHIADWASWVWAAVMVYVVFNILSPQWLDLAESINPAIGYTLAALALLLLAKIFTW